MSTADAPGGLDGSGGVQKLAQLKRSRGAHRGVLTTRATAIRQAGGALEDVDRDGFTDSTTHGRRR